MPPARRRSSGINLLPLVRRSFRGARRRLTPVLVLLLIAILATLGGVLIGQKRVAEVEANRLTVAVLNVQQGEASWIRTPHGHFILIGAGPPEQGASVLESLKDAGAMHIDLLIIPYPYAEAIGGLRPVTDALVVRRAVEPGGKAVNQWQIQARDALDKRKVPLEVGRAGMTYHIDGAVIEILAPADPPVDVSPAAANNSLVVRVKWGDTSFLWAGGLQRAGEDALLARTPDVSANWLRAARFGTAEASSPEFIRLVSPEIAVVSVGPNTSGYPDSDTLQRLEASGARVILTSSQSDPLVFHSDGTRVTGPE